MDKDMTRSAEIDRTGMYRYELRRTWGLQNPALFVILNPSTADGEKDDPTIRRCMDFADRWGYGGIVVVNVFAFRATKPTALLTAADPVGPMNLIYIRQAMEKAGIVIAAWGAGGPKVSEPYEWIHEIAKMCGVRLHCLGTTADGSPKHPLYVRSDVKPVPYERMVKNAG
jgi:hypothetical protein